MHSQRLNRLAKDADEENKKAYKKWVESHTPAEIRRANNARRLLKTKLASFPKGQIHDDRAVSQPKSSYILFFQERHASGDLKHLSTIEAAKVAGKEWTALSASDKKVRFIVYFSPHSLFQLFSGKHANRWRL